MPIIQHLGTAIDSGDGGEILRTNLVLNLDASDTNSYSGSGTTWTDLSGNNNDATLVNGPTFNSANGGSIVFDGTNDSVTISGMSSFAPSAITFEVWFYNTPASGYKGLLDKGRDNFEGYSLAVNASKIIWKARVGSSNEFALDSDQYQDSIWTHAVGTYDGTDLKLYVNATLKTTTNASGTLGSNSHGITIGSTNDNLYFDGRISQARIYSSALSASQVLHNYNATKSNYTLLTTNLVLHLDAGNSSSYSGSGTTWSDISGNGNNLTLTNGPTFSTDNGGIIGFDGTNDFAVSGLNQPFFQFGYGDYSYGVWVKYDTVSDYESVLSSGSGADQNSWQLDYLSNRIVHNIRSSSGNVTLTTSLNPTAGSWYYLFVVNDRSENELKFYINGTLDTTHSDSNYGSLNVGNFSDATSTYNVFNVGRNRGQSQYFDGSIGQVHVYKGKALSASEVLQNYNATKSTYGH